MIDCPIRRDGSRRRRRDGDDDDDGGRAAPERIALRADDRGARLRDARERVLRAVLFARGGRGQINANLCDVRGTTRGGVRVRNERGGDARGVVREWGRERGALRVRVVRVR